MSPNGEEKSVRRDSARNRAKLVAAAREMFAERGFAATLDDIARHAGVGTGTAYRHFPNKQAVAAEVIADLTQRIAQDARSALTIADPWAALVTFFERTAARTAADRGLHETLTGMGNAQRQAELWPEILSPVTELFDRAQRAGVVRADAAPQDVAAIFAMLGPAYRMSPVAEPAVWRRYLALILDGLRATERPPLPVPPPPVDTIERILAAGKPRSG